MNVFQRFSKVQAAMAKHGIEKSGKNQQQGYKYRGIDQVMNNVGPILAENEVLILPSVISHHMDRGTTKNGGVMYHHTVEVEYQITGPEGDSMGPFKSRGECIDTSDKGLNKACTAAYKYWVLTALCIPTEASDDADSVTPEGGYATITPGQERELVDLMLLTSTESSEFLGWLNITRLDELALEHFQTAKNALLAKKEKMERDYAAGEKGQ